MLKMIKGYEWHYPNFLNLYPTTIKRFRMTNSPPISSPYKAIAIFNLYQIKAQFQTNKHLKFCHISNYHHSL